MNKKVSLIFEDGKYKVCINETILTVDEDIDNSFKKFKQIIDNNSIEKEVSWDTIKKELKVFNHKDLEINNDYKTVAFRKMKYFYNTGKVFYILDNQMISLIGGYALFKLVIKLECEGKLNDCEGLLELCKATLEYKANYRISESTFFVSSAKFSYGSAEYNFSTGKINKGTSLQKGTFEEFKSYVLNTIK